MNYRRLVLSTLSLMLLPLAAFADAGSVLFVYGKAFVQGADGSRTAIARGDAVQSGDMIVTSANGRVQLRMSDGGLLALRPQSEFLIEDYNDPAENARTGKQVEDDSPRSFFNLLKGGFRSITGAIGQERKTDYRVKTPVATIGIRGTDYTAVLCAGDCGALQREGSEPIADGLYIGVAEGGVVLTNDAGSLDLDAGQFGYVAELNADPESSADAETVLSASNARGGSTGDSDGGESDGGSGSAAAAQDSDQSASDNSVQAFAADQSPGESPAGSPAGSDSSTPPATAEVPQLATDGTGGAVDLTDGDEPPPDTTAAIAYAAGPLNAATGFSASTPAGEAAIAVDGQGSVTGFSGPGPVGDSRFNIGSAATVNAGRDENRVGATGLQWGRWSTGTIDVTSATGTATQPLTTSSLHWVTGPEGAPTPTLSTQGTAQFSLVGNTNPTDNNGNVGTLGSASLVADFTAQTVDAEVNVAFTDTNQVWAASAEGVSINGSDATFGGDFDSVTVTDTVTSVSSDGSGRLDGFFSGTPAGAVTGAGLTYSLGNPAGTTVSGAAAFQLEDVD